MVFLTTRPADKKNFSSTQILQIPHSLSDKHINSIENIEFIVKKRSFNDNTLALGS